MRLILAEDTRTARHLLDRHDIAGRLESYTEHNHTARVAHILELLADADVALVSEAGMPGISDPGQALVEAVAAAGFQVVGLPGASAVPLAVAVAGFPVPSFTYLGFLPRRAGDRRALLRANATAGHALVCFESPHRLQASLHDIELVLGDRRLAICRELTKLHEEIFRGTSAEALAHFTAPRGEFTLVVAGRTAQAESDTDAGDLRAFLDERAAAGESARDAVAAAVARFGAPRRIIYTAWEEAKRARAQAKRSS